MECCNVGNVVMLEKECSHVPTATPGCMRKVLFAYLTNFCLFQMSFNRYNRDNRDDRRDANRRRDRDREHRYDRDKERYDRYPGASSHSTSYQSRFGEPPGPRGVCWNCFKPGNISPDCPLKKDSPVEKFTDFEKQNPGILEEFMKKREEDKKTAQRAKEISAITKAVALANKFSSSKLVPKCQREPQ